jgi:hypothetical protein
MKVDVSSLWGRAKGRKLMSERNELSLGDFVCFRTYFVAFRSNIKDTLLILVSDAARPVRRFAKRFSRVDWLIISSGLWSALKSQLRCILTPIWPFRIVSPQHHHKKWTRNRKRG